MTEAAPPGQETRQPRPPTLLDAILPVVVLITLIALTIWLLGVSATDGPLQVALLLSASFASLIAFKNGHTVAAVADAAVGGVTSAIGAIFILLAVGALIGMWNVAGTIPTVVDYGDGFIGFNVPTATPAVAGPEAEERYERRRADAGFARVHDDRPVT